MPRPSSYPNDPLPRLRAQLSKIDGHTVTRAHLAARTGVPEPTLRDIELRKFKLTNEVALKIAITTGASSTSLVNGDDPILDFLDNPLSKDSPKAHNPNAGFVKAIRQLFEAALETALEKKVGFLMAHSFSIWLSETAHTYGLDPLLAQKLTERLGSFDPDQMFPRFRPQNPKLAAEWREFNDQLDREARRLCSGSEKIGYDACRELALETIRRQRTEAKAKAKPSAKQPIPRRKAA
jgi:hypothetical protein